MIIPHFTLGKNMVAAALTAAASALIFLGVILFSNEINAGASFILWVSACFIFGFAALNGLRSIKAKSKPKAPGGLLVLALALGLVALTLPKWFVATAEVKFCVQFEFKVLSCLLLCFF